MTIQKVIYWPDTHVPYQDQQAVDTALKILRWYKPDTVVLLGDFLDYLPLSRHIADSISERASVNMEHEFAEGNKLLDKISSVCQNLVYHAGNHEARHHAYTDKHPEVRGLVEPHIGLCFKDRRRAGCKIKYLEYNECHRIGNLYSTHGWYTNQHHAQKHVQAFGRSIVYGHIHDLQIATQVSPIDCRKKHIGVCLGSLCNQNPGYMRNAPNKWVHCIGIAAVRENGDFNLDPVIISEGAATYAGKTFYA